MYFHQYNLLDAHFCSTSLKAHDILFLWFDMQIILTEYESVQADQVTSNIQDAEKAKFLPALPHKY